jgi:integrase
MKGHVTDPILFEKWLENNKQLSKSTMDLYVGGLTLFLKNNPDIDIIDDYNSFIIKTCIKKRCTHFYTILYDYIRFKIEDTNLRNKLLDSLIKPEPKMDILRERRYLSEEQILDVVNNLADFKHRIISLIQTLTGVRAGDVLKLKKGTIFPEEYEGKTVLRVAVTGKRNKRNIIYIHDEIAQQLVIHYITNYKETFNDYYFIEFGTMKNRKGDINNINKMIKMNYQWYWKDLKQALNVCNISGKDFATHDFRRCFARRAWTRYKDIHVLQGLLNHVDPKTTLRYLEQSGLKNIDYHKDLQLN